MVEHPAEYKWSSYRVNAQGEANTCIQPHQLYLSLGVTEELRQKRYRELFRYELEPGIVDSLRKATNGNYALGDIRFTQKIEQALGRRVVSGGKGGRLLNKIGFNRGLSPLSSLHLVDPLGLISGVTIWQPVGWGESSFGHVSTEVNGTTYTFAPGGMKIMSTSTYTSKNSFRDGMEVMLNLSPKQEASLQACLAAYRDKYNAVTNNCASPVQDCLKSIGIDTRNKLLPVSLGNKLLDMGITNGAKDYPASRPSNGMSTPWAR